MADRLQELLSRQVAIFDGAMGTEIYDRHFFVNVSFDGLCLTSPDVIREIHQAYIDAGADVLTTNTFGANANKLATFGLAEKTREINLAAAQLARGCAGPDRLVAGSIGPFGEMAYGRDFSEDEIHATLAAQAAALAEGGVDFLLFETLTSQRDVERACRVGVASGLPYAVTVTVDRNGETTRGESLKSLLAPVAAASRRATAFGLNCGSGPESSLSALEVLMPLTDLPVIVQPNAGVPKQVDGRMIYMTSPEYLTTYALRYVSMGVRAIGGCCGTGPAHIRDIVRSVRPLAGTRAAQAAVAGPVEIPLRPRPPTAGKSRFASKLAAGEWVTSVEITPPRGFDLRTTIERARQCRMAGVDAINIPDGPRASARISPLVTALSIQRDAGIEAVLHFCCRDKSLIGMQADLLGCAAVGIHNILFVTGDPPKLGDFPFSSAVFDADSIGMARIQDRMNRGADLGGKPLDPPTNVLIGVGADPNAIDMKRELRRTREKVEAGAEFVITQPVFAPDALLSFVEAIADLKVPVIAGIWPLASLRNAEFMKNEVPGVVVPDEVMRRMARADTKEAQREEGICLARDTIAEVRTALAGVQVSAPFGNVVTALAVLA